MRVNFATVIGILLLVLGAVALIVPGIGYTTEEEILDVGPIEATAEDRKFIAIPVWASVIILGAGVVLIVAGVRSRRP